MSDLPQVSGPKFLMPSEKAGRLALGGAATAVAVTGGYYALPYIIQFLTMGIEAGFKMLVLGGLIGLVLFLGWFVMNPQVQAAFWYLVMGWIDSLVATVVRISPVKRVKAYVQHYLVPMKVNAEQLLNKAIAREASAQKRVTSNDDALGKAEARAEYCLRHGSPDQGKTWSDKTLRTEFSVLSGKIRMMRDARGRLGKRHDFQKGCVEVLRSLLDVISAYTEVTEFNVQMMVEEYESAGEMAEGSREVRGMLGASEKTKMYNQAAQNIQDQTNLWMAEVQNVMSTVQKQIVSGQIDDAIGEENLIRELTSRVGNMSTFAEGQRQLAQGGSAVLLQNAKSQVMEAVLVEKPKPPSNSDSSNRFGGFLPKK